MFAIAVLVVLCLLFSCCFFLLVFARRVISFLKQKLCKLKHATGTIRIFTCSLMTEIIQGDSKRIHQNHHAIFKKRKTIENSSLDTCVIHIFKFLFHVLQVLNMTTTAGTIDMKQLSLKEIPPKVNVFCAVSQDKVYAPFFL